MPNLVAGESGLFCAASPAGIASTANNVTEAINGIFLIRMLGFVVAADLHEQS